VCLEENIDSLERLGVALLEISILESITKVGRWVIYICGIFLFFKVQ